MEMVLDGNFQKKIEPFCVKLAQINTLHSSNKILPAYDVTYDLGKVTLLVGPTGLPFPILTK